MAPHKSEANNQAETEDVGIASSIVGTKAAENQQAAENATPVNQAPQNQDVVKQNPPPSILKVYPVGNLISARSMTSESSGMTTKEQWNEQYSQTLQGLDELADIVETMCADSPMAISTFPQSLSLVVRHSEEGHAEIADLLKSLAGDHGESIQMSCRMLYADVPPKSSNPDHTEADRERLISLLSKKNLSAKQSAELKELMPGPDADELDSSYVYNVTLNAGLRTPWSLFGQQYTAVGRVAPNGKQVELRVDYITDQGDEQTVPFGAQVLKLEAGRSAIFKTQFYGSTLVWLITAKVSGIDTAETPVQTENEGVPQIATKKQK